MNEDDLQAIRDRRDAVTQGQWFHIEDLDSRGAVEHSVWCQRNTSYIADTVSTPNNAAFITKAPDDIDALLNEVDNLRAQLRNEVNWLRTGEAPAVQATIRPEQLADLRDKCTAELEKLRNSPAVRPSTITVKFDPLPPTVPPSHRRKAERREA